jgi:hypothetical protein
MIKLKKRINKLRRILDSKRRGLRCGSDFIVGGMATMPSRKATFEISFKSIIRQVDRLYLYLDGFDEVPEIVRNDQRVVAILSKDQPGLYANGKFLGLELESRRCMYASFDDDIQYSYNYIACLRQALAEHKDHAVVGLHGTRLIRPFVGYYRSRKFHGTYHSALNSAKQVDILGTGAVLFQSNILNLDVTEWPKVSMADLGLALEAAKTDIPLISIARKRFTTYSLAINQTDSLIVARKKDSTLQNKLGEELVELRSRNSSGDKVGEVVS